MRTWTETHREGTEVGPIDWSHPWIAESRIPVETLREIEAHPDEWGLGGYALSGGHIWRFCMYDGWPHWKPGPAFLIRGPLGNGEWIWLNGYGVIEVYRRRKAGTT